MARTSLMRVVVLTGAGASVPLGMPATRQFVEKALKRSKVDTELLQESIDACKRKAKAEGHAQEVDIEMLLDHVTSLCNLSASLPYEDFNFLPSDESEQLRQYFKDKGSEYDELRQQLLSLVVEEYCEVDPDLVYPLYHSLIWGIARMLGVATISVFTLNYDQAIETYVEKATDEVTLIDRFDRRPNSTKRLWDQKIIEGFLNAHLFGLTAEVGLTNPPTDGSKVNVLLVKPHGSTKWARHKKTLDIHLIDCIPRDIGNFETVIHYPTLLQKARVEPFTFALRLLIDACKSADIVVIIRTSFRDTPVLDALSLASEKTKFFVCDLCDIKQIPQVILERFPDKARYSLVHLV